MMPLADFNNGPFKQFTGLFEITTRSETIHSSLNIRTCPDQVQNQFNY